MTPKTTTKQAATQATATAAPKKRTYNSSRRKRQAAETRAEVLLAAMRLFNELGWAGTTVAAIADDAGVAVETVYSGFGSKKALVRDAADASAVGDAEPVAYIDRPEVQQLAAGALADRIRVGMDILADLHERSAGIWRAVRDAAEGDEELTAWVLDGDQRRRFDVGRSLEMIFERPIPDSALDVIWVLYGPDSWRLLVQEGGRTRVEYQRILAEASLRLLGENATLVDAVIPA